MVTDFETEMASLRAELDRANADAVTRNERISELEKTVDLLNRRLAVVQAQRNEALDKAVLAATGG